MQEHQTAEKLDDVSADDQNTGKVQIVGVGASAGGLEAFSQFLQALPLKGGMGFVLIQHLDPKHKSSLVDLLAQTTALPVTEIHTGDLVKPDHVYVIPENTEVTVNHSKLRLHPRSAAKRPSSSIDRFMVSLAKDQHAHAIGVLLSGSSSDGTRGLAAIKAGGGTTFAQDKSASFPLMPESAIQAGAADYIMTPAEIAKALLTVRSKQRNSQHLQGLRLEQTQKSLDFDTILKILDRLTGVDMTNYKTATLQRRIRRRVSMLNLNSLAEYTAILESDPAEARSLYEDMLINVTGFFRDPSVLKFFASKLLPEIAGWSRPAETVRLWVAGCATGEEAYSLAIICNDYINTLNKNLSIKIIATDIDAISINKARRGIFPANELKNVSAQHKKEYFSETGNNFLVKDSIRKMCIFAEHNLLADPPFSSIDFISCNNVLIYLQTNAQQMVLSNFHYALKPGGFLALGPAESIGSSRNLFQKYDKKLRIYIREDVPASYHFSSINKMLERKTANGTNSKSAFESKSTVVATLADAMLLSRFTPASIVINSAMEIILFRGSTGKYLEAAPGKASFNIFKMARPGLILHLRNAVRSAMESDETYRRILHVTLSGVPQIISLSAVGLVLGDNTERYTLIVFENENTVVNIPGGSHLYAPDAPPTAQRKSDNKDAQIVQLERELAELQEEMRRLSEGQDEANAELQLANEEVRSSNEELQSLNEELETSGEELASTNEELLSMNQTLRASNDALKSARDYAESIIRTVREPLIVLGHDLRVISANEAFYRMFKVTKKTTEGKSIHTLGDGQWQIPKLQKLLDDIMLQNMTFEGYMVEHDFPDIGPKTMLLNARRLQSENGDTINILLSIEDITDRQHAQQAQQDDVDRLRFMAESMPQKIFTAKPSGELDYLSPHWAEFSKLSDEQLKQWMRSRFIHPDDLEATVNRWNHSIKTGAVFQMEHRLLRSDGVYCWHITSAHAFRDTTGKIILWVGSSTDIEVIKRTMHRAAELEQSTAALKRQRNQLVALNKAKQEFINLASHQLRTPATGVKQYIGMLREGFAGKVTPSQHEFLDKANSSNERQLQIIEDLLKVAQVDSGNLALDTAPTDLVLLVQSVIDEQSAQFEEHRQQVTFAHFEPAIIVDADSRKLRMVFENLIDNASKYSQNGKNITVKLGHTAAGVEIAVSDNGVGISKDGQRKLFQKFARIDNDMSVSVGGTGLGLYWSKKIIDLHQGSIKVTSATGKGSTFTVAIPLHGGKR